MARSFEAAIAAVEGAEFDRIVGYSVAQPKHAPRDPELDASFALMGRDPFDAVTRSLSRRFGSVMDAEDAVQDTVEYLLKTQPEIFHQPPETWTGKLYVLAKFRLLRLREGPVPPASIEGLLEVAGDAPFEGAGPILIPTSAANERARYTLHPGEREGWTRTQTIGAAQRFRDHHGRPPRLVDCKALHRLPTPDAIRKHFASFDEFILEAGMIPPLLGLRRKRWTAVEAARACESFRWRTNRWPNWSDAKRNPGALPGTGAMIRYFGGTRSIDIQLGVEAILGT